MQEKTLLNNNEQKPDALNFSENWHKNRLPPYLIASGVLSVLFLIIACINQGVEHFLLSASLLLTFVIGILLFFELLKTPRWLSLLVFSFFIELSIVLIAAVYPSYTGIPYILVAIAVSILVSTIVPNSRSSDWIITVGIIAAISVYQVNIVSPLAQFNNVIIENSVAILAGMLFLYTILQFILRRITFTLRMKLIFGSMALALIPLIVLSTINNQKLQDTYEQQVNQSMVAVSEQSAQNIDDFIATTERLLYSESKLSTIRAYISLNSSLRPDSTQEIQLKSTLQSLQAKEEFYKPSYAILDLNGKNIYDTDVFNIGKSERDTSYFQKTYASGIGSVSSVEYSPFYDTGYINFISPVTNELSETIGYLRARYDATILQGLLEETVTLTDELSYPILLDENGVRLADMYDTDQIYHSVVHYTEYEYTKLIDSNKLPQFISKDEITIPQKELAQSISTLKKGQFFTATLDVKGEDVVHIGTVTRLTYEPWSIVYLQDQTYLTGIIEEQKVLTSTITTSAALIVGILLTIVANLISAPILRLTEAAHKVSSGDLNVQLNINSRDEIGVLGDSFNSMTRQLKEFIDTLEKRVDERTRQLAEQNESLQFRSRQLQTVAEVARNIVSTREVGTLLTSVTQIVSERFGFYHVGIFLLDETGDYAVLRAANSEGGQRMLARQHRLRVGQVGIVGYATGTGEARIATDVGDDAVFFNNPDLPQTKSEMALPLMLGDRVIGALDIQSTKSNAFSDEDIELFITLANQIAIAINNNQLYESTTKALEETQNLYRQYLRQEWTRQNVEIGSRNYRFTPEGLVPYDEELPEINMVLNTGRPVFRTQKSDTDENEINSILAVPILLSGESIGAIYLQESAASDYVWSQSELSTIQSVADQVAQTLENARLFEQTIRRADRERKVLEITSRIRSTNDPQEMLRITLEELKKNLGVKQAQIVLNIDGNTTLDVSADESINSCTFSPAEGMGSL